MKVEDINKEELLGQFSTNLKFHLSFQNLQFPKYPKINTNSMIKKVLLLVLIHQVEVGKSLWLMVERICYNFLPFRWKI